MVRQGVPLHFRGIVWQLLAGIDGMSPEKKLYASYIKVSDNLAVFSSGGYDGCEDTLIGTNVEQTIRTKKTEYREMGWHVY